MNQILLKFYRSLPTIIIIIGKYFYFKYVKKNYQCCKHFPITPNGKLYFGRPLFSSDGKRGYFTQYYNEIWVPSKALVPYEYLKYKTEILYGEKVPPGISNLYIAKDCVLPLSIINNNANNESQNNIKAEISINKEKYTLSNLAQNRYHYLPFKKGSQISVKVNHEHVLGKTIPLFQEKKHSKRLVLVLFVDSLATEAFKLVPFSELMPFTHNFFKKGIVFNNCYANENWTLPSVPSFFSGKYTTNHKLYARNANQQIGENYSILSEFFQDDDYQTSFLSGVTGCSPCCGYVKGFDRVLYKYNLDCKEIVSSFLEHLRAFQNRDHFCWLSFLEANHSLYDIPDISCQTINSLEAHDYYDIGAKSPFEKYDKIETERYFTELKRLDFYLKLVYDYIDGNYQSDEFLIMLCSDHGTQCISKNNHSLSDSRVKVPLMVRGENIPNVSSDEIIENIDAFPILLKYCNINFDDKQIDGRLPKCLGGKEERKYAYSEDIFIGQTYKAVISDNSHRFEFETKYKVSKGSKINTKGYNLSLINKKSNEDETRKNTIKVNEYLQIVFKHIETFKA